MNRSLLIVEDDPEQLDALVRWFILAGYEVTGAHHPSQALEAASLRQFQVALLDANLPEMDGLQLMQRLNLHQDGIQAVILTMITNWPAPPCNPDSELLRGTTTKCQKTKQPGFSRKTSIAIVRFVLLLPTTITTF